MKKKIKFVDNINHKETVAEINIAGKDHLAAQIKYPAKVIKQKKGKGSFKRVKFKFIKEEE